MSGCGREMMGCRWPPHTKYEIHGFHMFRPPRHTENEKERGVEKYGQVRKKIFVNTYIKPRVAAEIIIAVADVTLVADGVWG